jgi:hypothetical protein
LSRLRLRNWKQSDVVIGIVEKRAAIHGSHRRRKILQTPLPATSHVEFGNVVASHVNPSPNPTEIDLDTFGSDVE